jgi:hypothetical protein
LLSHSEEVDIASLLSVVSQKKLNYPLNLVFCQKIIDSVQLDDKEDEQIEILEQFFNFIFNLPPPIYNIVMLLKLKNNDFRNELLSEKFAINQSLSVN